MKYLMEKMMGMKLIRIATVTVLLAISMAGGTAMAQDANMDDDHYAAEAHEVPAHEETSAIEAGTDSLGPWKAFAYVGACLGAGLGVLGGGMGIGKIASSAAEGIARQPEAAGQMFLAWLIPAAMIEGMALFAIVICMMIAIK